MLITALSALVLLLWACSPEASTPTSPTVTASFAKGGNGGGGSTPTPSVNAADPDSLPRGSVAISLEVIGSGFTTGSEVEFELDGAPTDLIVTNSVTYVDETRLIANVNVSVDALTVQYDIAVRNGPKKKGVGIDLLKVVEATPIPVVEPEEISTIFGGRNELLAVSGSWAVGWSLDDDCPWAYNLATNTKTCIDVPWAQAGSVFIHGVTGDGVVVGVAQDRVSNERVGIRIDFANDPNAIVRLAPPAGWEFSNLSWERPVNGQGLILGTVRRESNTKKGGPNNRGSEYAAVIWNADGSIRSTSAVGSARAGGGLSDLLPDGTLRAGMDNVAVWDGSEGGAAVTLEAQTIANVRLDIVTPDGVVYGTIDNRIVMWETPTSSASVVTSIPGARDFLISGLDEEGNLLGRADYQTDGMFGFCINRDDPTGGMTKLAPRSYFAGATTFGGSGGSLYGNSDKMPT
ncbi:MAG: hypothetical protein R3324_03375, partial [Halobacteriales archaeon]|nr:hypothetical protein [Halobacteriales archaeon]